MAEPTRCPRCGARIFSLRLSSGTQIELDATPRPDGLWAIVNGNPIPAVRFERGLIAGRLPEFANTALHSGHYGITCAKQAAERIESKPKTGTR